MINHISPKRGNNTVGLVIYLFGPGRHNEHQDQRVIAAADTLGFEDGTRFDHEADRDEIVALGRELDSHRRSMGVEMPGGHVWHCSLSLPPEESTDELRLSDAQWAEAVRYAVEQMGFDGPSGKAPCRWVAVHHGKSVGGNEHVHLGVNLVREDGTFASIYRDRVTMSRVSAELERRFGLRVVEGRAGAGMPGLTRAEIERTARTPGKAEPDRVRLARAVRGAATAASSETDFVRRLHSVGVLSRPRYDKGGQRGVVGYSVALRPATKSEAPVWFGGGRLGRDLTLPRLREHWDASPTDVTEALAEWSRTGGALVRRTAVYGTDAWEQAAQVLVGVREQLAGVPVDDFAAWAGAAREASGVLAAWSARIETNGPGPLADAADVLARSAQTHHGRPHARRTGAVRDLRGVAMVVFAASKEGAGAAGQVALLRQFTRLMEALHDMHIARGQAGQAAALADVARTRLVHLHQARPVGAASGPTPRPPGVLPRRRGTDFGR